MLEVGQSRLKERCVMQGEREKENTMDERDSSFKSLPREQVRYPLQSLEMAVGMGIWSVSPKRKKKFHL